jgi:hypothetical protein
MGIEEIISEFESVKADVVSNFGALSEQQLNWKPSEDVWSVGQCIEHLILSKELFLPILDSVASGTRTNTFWENWSPLRALGTRIYFRYIRSDQTKVKAPTERIVPMSDIKEDVVERYAIQQEKITEKLRGIPQDFVDRTTLTSPFLGIVTYKLSDGLMILSEHDRRHVRQALRITALEGYPKA